RDAAAAGRGPLRHRQFRELLPGVRGLRPDRPAARPGAAGPRRAPAQPRGARRAMRLIRKRAYARAGLIGNPSAGYHGKTISLIVRHFWAEASLYEWEDVELLLSQDDRSRFGSITELVRDVERHGYYGGIRLVKATVKRFAEYCRRQGLPLHDRNFS